MKVLRLAIRNYKSLRNVEMAPQGLATLVGPNGAGKSNFANAVSFLAEAHQHGLEMAVARKGGYENIAFRKQRRSKSGIRFESEIDVEAPDWAALRHGSRRARTLRLAHAFAFKAARTGIKADYKVTEESFRVTRAVGKHAEVTEPVVRLERTENGGVERTYDTRDPFAEYMQQRNDAYLRDIPDEVIAEPQELMIAAPPLRNVITATYSRALAQMGVFQLSASVLRSPGTPTPNPELAPGGGNLPALVEWFQHRHPKVWAAIVETMKNIMPSLENITTQVLHSRTLGLVFQEAGVGRAWTVDDVSDGTIHTLCLLLAAADPRNTALIIEEPENSVHPWVVRQLGEQLREIAGEKTVIVTTHSPLFVDALKPHELWIVSRKKGATVVENLPALAPDIEREWREGNFKLSEYLDSGLIPKSVPVG